MADLATLVARLAEAETAYHALMTGALEVTVQIDQLSTTYNKADAELLAAYIARLQSEIAAEDSTVPDVSRRIGIRLQRI